MTCHHTIRYWRYIIFVDEHWIRAQEAFAHSFLFVAESKLSSSSVFAGFVTHINSRFSLLNFSFSFSILCKFKVSCVEVFIFILNHLLEMAESTSTAASIRKWVVEHKLRSVGTFLGPCSAFYSTMYFA